jgi:hypothetical protein
MMSRSCGSFTSLVSHSSINSHTKILNSKDFKNYIANIEDYIIKVSNDCYHFADKYDKKLYHIINRYDDRTNKLFIDLRYRDAECRRLNNKIDYISKEVSKIKEGSNNTIYICDITDIRKDIIESGDRISNNIFIILCIYTIYVLSLVITY